MKINNVLVVFQGSTREVQRKALEKVFRQLTAKGINHDYVERTRLNSGLVKGRDLIISVGGDGTFLRTAHYVMNGASMLGINPNPVRKEGFFTATTADGFGKILKKIMSGKKTPKKLLRLEAWINKKRVKELALNEVFVGRRQAYNTARYTIHIGRIKEDQRSSGVIIASPAGSTAWARSAGGEKLPLTSRQFQVVVREPYYGRITKRLLRRKLFSGKQNVKVTSAKGLKVVVIDSLSKEYKLNIGDVLTVKASKQDLKVFR